MTMCRMYTITGMNKTGDLCPEIEQKRGLVMEQEEFREELIRLFLDTKEYAGRFQKKTYRADIEMLKQKYAELLAKVKETIETSEEALRRAAQIVPEYAAEVTGAVSSRRKRELQSVDSNLAMVSFFLPLLGEIQSAQARPFTERIVDLWNANMPESKIGCSTAEQIEAGFSKGMFCYITTAVCESLDKPDDCYELTLLREYRDGYLLSTEDGRRIVEEYYNIAPTIVKRINREEHAEEIYREIWDRYLGPCVHLIEEDGKEECCRLYSDMVRSLERKYLYS